MTQPHASTDVTRYVWAHGVAQLLLWSGFYYLLPALSAKIALETGWSVLNISITYTGAFLLWAIMAPVAGMLIDKGHGRKVMRIGAIVGVVLLVGLSMTSNETVFSVLVVLLGACMAATLYDPCFSVMMLRLKSNGTNAIATVTLIAGFATLLTFPLVIGLSLIMGWQQIVLVFAVLASIGMFILPSEVAAVGSKTQSRNKLPLERGPVLIALSFGLAMMGHAILLFLLPVALVSDSGDAQSGLLALAILGPAQIAGRTAWKYYGAAWSPRACAILMFALMCLPAALMLVAGTAQPVIYAALIIQGACYGVHTILRPSLAQRYLHPTHLGRGLGAIAMVGVLMMSVGPAVGGLVWTNAGLSGLMIAILVLNGLALVLSGVLQFTPPKEVIV